MVEKEDSVGAHRLVGASVELVSEEGGVHFSVCDEGGR